MPPEYGGGAKEVTTPVTGSTVASPGLSLDHVPPAGDVTYTVAVSPWHILVFVPPMPTTTGLTVNTATASHPSRL